MTTGQEEALQAVWRALRKQNPALPSAKIIVVLGKRQETRCAQIVAEPPSPRILVSAQTLRSPEETLQLLLHLAAHLLAPGGGLGKPSKAAFEGVYHTTEFRTVATLLGLESVKVGKNWTGKTVLARNAAERYANELKMLTAVSDAD